MIDWDKVPSGYKWAAMDSDGEWYAYMEEPVLDSKNWSSLTHCHFISHGDPTEVDYRHSKVSRYGNDMLLDNFFKL